MDIYSIFEVLAIFVAVLICIVAFFIPTIIAYKKSHPHKLPIFLMNIVGGLIWGLGWIIALIWCFVMPEHINLVLANFNKPPLKGGADEIEKLYNLKEKGIISQADFDHKKQKIIGS